MTKPGSHDPHVRVFFALWPNAGERAALAAWQPPLQELCGGRAMRADTLHATLAFIGDIEVRRLEALKLAALEVASESVELHLDQACYWSHNHIVHAAPSSLPSRLTALVDDLEQRLRAHRFRRDQQIWKPHVTLLRNAKWSDRPLPEMPDVTWRMQDFVLVQSQRNAQGAHYEVLARFPLARSPMI